MSDNERLVDLLRRDYKRDKTAKKWGFWGRLYFRIKNSFVLRNWYLKTGFAVFAFLFIISGVVYSIQNINPIGLGYGLLLTGLGFIFLKLIELSLGFLRAMHRYIQHEPRTIVAVAVVAGAILSPINAGVGKNSFGEVIVFVGIGAVVGAGIGYSFLWLMKSIEKYWKVYLVLLVMVVIGLISSNS